METVNVRVVGEHENTANAITTLLFFSKTFVAIIVTALMFGSFFIAATFVSDDLGIAFYVILLIHALFTLFCSFIVMKFLCRPESYIITGILTLPLAALVVTACVQFKLIPQENAPGMIMLAFSCLVFYPLIRKLNKSPVGYAVSKGALYLVVGSLIGSFLLYQGLGFYSKMFNPPLLRELSYEHEVVEIAYDIYGYELGMNKALGLTRY